MILNICLGVSLLAARLLVGTLGNVRLDVGQGDHLLDLVVATNHGRAVDRPGHDDRRRDRSLHEHLVVVRVVVHERELGAVAHATTTGQEVSGFWSVAEPPVVLSYVALLRPALAASRQQVHHLYNPNIPLARLTLHSTKLCTNFKIFRKKIFVGTKVTSEAFLSISQNLKVTRLLGGTQRKLWTCWRNFDPSRSFERFLGLVHGFAVLQ